MGSLVAGLLVFGLLAVLVLTALDADRDDAEDIGGALTLGVWFTYLVHADTVLTAAYLDVARVPVPKVVGLVLGIAVIAAGVALFAWSSRVLVARGDFHGLVSHKLVTSGPYRWMRHPQDTGWALVLLGIAICGRSLLALALVALFAFFVGRLWRFDEKQLDQRFGDDWRRYRADTPQAVLG